MFCRLCLFMVLALVPQGARVVIPDTPAGHTFREWLAGLRSPD
jgi:hypothetical protein